MKEEFCKKLGSNISRYRKEKGITQEELSNRIGVNRITINKIEKGIQHSSIYNMYLISKELGIHIDKLITGIDEIDFMI